MLNQLAAHKSWKRVSERIIYLNAPHPEFIGEKTEFVETTDWPAIQHIALELSLWMDWGAFVNADIILAPHLPEVVKELTRRMAWAAFSYRYEFDPSGDIHKAKVMDNGLDFFLAKPHVWNHVQKAIPPHFRIGHQFFDTWLFGYFKRMCGSRCFDITPSRCVFHPKHGGRKFGFEISPEIDNETAKAVSMRIPRLTVLPRP